MKNVNVINQKSNKVTRSKDIPEGTIFTGRIGHYPNTLFIRAEYSGRGVIVGLDGEKYFGVWDSPECPVYEYTPVKVTITVSDIDAKEC